MIGTLPGKSKANGFEYFKPKEIINVWGARSWFKHSTFMFETHAECLRNTCNFK